MEIEKSKVSIQSLLVFRRSGDVLFFFMPVGFADILRQHPIAKAFREMFHFGRNHVQSKSCQKGLVEPFKNVFLPITEVLQKRLLEGILLSSNAFEQQFLSIFQPVATRAGEIGNIVSQHHHAPSSLQQRCTALYCSGKMCYKEEF